MPALEHGTDSDTELDIHSDIISLSSDCPEFETSESESSSSSSMNSEDWQRVLESHPWYGCHPMIPLYYPRFWV